MCYYSLGECEKAKQHHEKNLNISAQIGDKASEASAYRNLGNCYHFLGQYEKAIQHHEKCLNIAKKIGNKAGEGNAHGSLGNCCFSLGLYEKAIQHHEKRLNIATQIGDMAGEGITYGNLGNCYGSLGQYEKAIQNHQKWLNIATQIGDKAGEGSAYGNLGNDYLSLGQYDKAITHYEKWLNITTQIGDKTGEETAYGNLGSCYGSLGQYEKAIKHHEKWLKIATRTGDKDGELKAYGGLGLCYSSLGQFQEAELNQRKCLSSHEELFQNSLKKDEYEIAIRNVFCFSYKDLTRTLICQDKIKESLVIAERGRSGALAELMLNSYSVQSSELLGEKFSDISQIQEVVATIDATVLFLSLYSNEIYFWVIQPSGDIEFKKESHGLNIPELAMLISNARMRYMVPHDVNCEDRSLANLYSEKLVKRTELKAVFPLAATPKNVSTRETVEFTKCPLRSALIKKESLASATDKKRNVYDEEESEDQLNQLYQIVLSPIRELIKGPQVVIVPQSELYLVPYAALKDNKGQHVAESLQVRLVPSLATAKMMRDFPQKAKGAASPLIIGDPATGKLPRLLFAGEEARAIGNLLNVHPLTGEEATKEQVLECIENASLIHIAAHGNMERGEILLAPNRGNAQGIAKQRQEDYMLMVSDLEKKCLKAKLVVLSCCHSARGEVNSEGVIGIARAFLGAGARSVLVALWAIEDKSTMVFMKSFYKHLKNGKKANESLNFTMKTMRETEGFCAPRHWAPFILIGDDVTI